LASHALAMLSRLFRHGELDVHGAFVSVAHQRGPTPGDRPSNMAESAEASVR
jgi:hypothetical protein